MGSGNDVFAKVALFFLAFFVALIVGEMIIRGYYAMTSHTIGWTEEEICAKQRYLWATSSEVEREYYKSAGWVAYSNTTGIRPHANISRKKWFIGQNRTMVRVESSINSKGIKSFFDHSLRKQPDKTRIAVVGDSFTWGADVPMVFSYPNILNHLVKDSEVINFGIEGIGLDTMYLRWKYDVLPYHPDVVVLGIYVDDIRRMGPCIDKPKVVNVNGSVQLDNFPPPRWNKLAERYTPPSFESYLIKHVYYTVHYFGGVAKHQFEYGFSIAGAIFDEINSVSLVTNTTFMVLVIERGNTQPDRDQQAAGVQLKTLLEVKQIPWVSAQEAFDKINFTPKDIYEGDVGHFGPDGYAILAQIVRNKLEQLKVIPPQPHASFAYDPEWEVLYFKEDTANKTWAITPYFYQLNNSYTPLLLSDVLDNQQIIESEFSATA